VDERNSSKPFGEVVTGYYRYRGEWDE
jgi:hypothetical protein